MQQGSVMMSERKHGPAVWQFRWSETGAQGQRVYRKRVVGTVEEYPIPEAVRAVCRGLIAKPNPAVQLMKPLQMTVGELCQHFRQRELMRDDNWRSYSTRRNYLFLLKRWIIPRWGNLGLGEVRTIEVEQWLRSLPRARSTCAKIRNLMSVLFNHAWRHDLYDRNPIKLVRQSAKRRTAPSVLTPVEIKLLLDNLDVRERTLVLLAASTGLRQSEFVCAQMGRYRFLPGHHECDALDHLRHRWPMQDRSFSEAGACPSHPCRGADSMARSLPYREPHDWVFANEHHRGRHPYWGQAILRTIVRPVAQRIGIEKWIGWHIFRHTYSTLLRSVGAEFKVMQELMRHSSLRSTIDIYTQAVTPAKRAAQAAVLSLVFPAKPLNKVQLGSKKGSHRRPAA